MSDPKDIDKMDTFTLPEGRLINHSLFVKDKYDEKATAAYKVEVVIPNNDPGLVALENMLLDAADKKWGAGSGDDPDLVLPLLDGDKHAKKREKKGKEGDAYKGMTIIRASTIYNKDGVDGPGGIQVYDMDAELLLPARQGEMYPGCFGIVAVNIGFYKTADEDNGIKFYLAAFQKTREGERLVRASDRSGLFKPVTREGGAPAGEGRRRRQRG